VIGEPVLGDAFGEILRAVLRESRATTEGDSPQFGPHGTNPVVEIVERDDGFVRGAPAAWYLADPEHWWPVERDALDLIRGETLDIGAGSGRVALAMQHRGVAVTALDVSPGAVEVARQLGVQRVEMSTVDEHAGMGKRYDSFVLFGNNLGLLGPREQAPGFLATLAAMARPGAMIVAQGTDPYRTDDPLALAYQENNRKRGRLPGLYRQRIRYRGIATPYLDYLMCSVAELEEIVAGTDWKLTGVDERNSPIYVAKLELMS
jgi:2-polyprenyl-3-methyl-5-hydroxy-6-metoxy-1,4-benzoquinol methylase